jgi:hypothetical protein
MKVTGRVVWVSMLIAGMLVAGVCRADETREKAALQAAEEWLALVDSGGYDRAWDDAAELIRKAVTKQDWQKTMETFRSPLGRVVERKWVSLKYTDTLPGVPDGDYVVIQYETRFEKKKASIETITPALEKDGRWRIAGYYIR